MNVPRETEDKLREYGDLVRKWNPRINLVAAGSLSDFDERHIRDSLQLAELADARGGHWVDLGSGGGLPGLVTAIAYGDRPVKVTLVESDKRKAAFLRTVARQLDLQKVDVVNARIEQLAPLRADYISARALAPLPKLITMVKRHLSPEGVAWLMKGRNWKEEHLEATKDCRFDMTAFPSKTEPEAAILKITGVSDA
ncbi:16S rRNA (guanine(527)-N(7))-methyltransferase RsmG [Paracoccus sp. T5]|uniref:16S rRNA (guanine(527)-N(7))-methyltransferase RsmG n=1 Tax=Paracoccus sp. T5 TaxID=3402161 RepID=UPI003ADFEF39